MIATPTSPSRQQIERAVRQVLRKQLAEAGSRPAAVGEAAYEGSNPLVVNVSAR